jgi:carbamate kinase
MVAVSAPGPIVAAVGGNALVQPEQSVTVAVEQGNARRAAAQLAPLGGSGLVVTHGNGPQVGALARGSAASDWEVPLHLLVAQSQGHIGHLLQRELAAALPGRSTVCVLTHVVVDPDDPGFAHPTKPIGPVLTASDAQRWAASDGWQLVGEGERWHRVVPSPEPLAVPELDQIGALVRRGSVVVAGGGGGIPVALDGDGSWTGVEAVVDKDLTSALIAESLGAASLVLLCDVDGLYEHWGDPRRCRLIRHGRANELAQLAFEPGTMGPKVAAACRFATATGRRAHIGALDDAGAVAEGRAGTVIEP